MIGGRKAAIFSELRVDVITADKAEMIAELPTRKSEELSVSSWEKANALPDSSAPDSFVNLIKDMVSSQLKEALVMMKLTE
jgi:hypothetical protein